MERCESSGCIEVTEYSGGYTRVHSTITDTTMQCTPAEFVAFRERMKAGDYDHIGVEAVQP